MFRVNQTQVKAVADSLDDKLAREFAVEFRAKSKTLFDEMSDQDLLASVRDAIRTGRGYGVEGTPPLRALSAVLVMKPLNAGERHNLDQLFENQDLSPDETAMTVAKGFKKKIDEMRGV